MTNASRGRPMANISLGATMIYNYFTFEVENAFSVLD